MTAKLETAEIPTICLLLSMAYQDGIDVYQGVLNYLAKRRQPWHLQIVREHAPNKDILRQVDLSACAGIICDDLSYGTAKLVARRHETPLVVLYAEKPKVFAKRPRTVLVNIDSAAIGRLAANFLAKETAYVSFGFVACANRPFWSNIRATTFIRTLKSGHRQISRFNSPTVNRRKSALIRYLQSLPKPAAVFADHDRTAEEVLAACTAAKLRVPNEIAVLGVDNERIACSHTQPPLSSIQPDFVSVGFRAAQALDDLLANRKTRREVICHGLEIVERGSTHPPSTAARLVRRAEEIIASESCRGLKALELARRLKVSRRLLDLRYRQISGLSILERIIDLRLKNIHQLLTRSSLPLAEVIAASGFTSATNARRLFRARFGKTMRQVRRDKAN